MNLEPERMPVNSPTALKDSPLVTVLMPVYNGELYMREAIESILLQTWHDFELIIIDDGSSDGSVSIAQSFQDPRIRLLQNEKNIGITCTLDRGLRQACGKYLVRMDSDDLSLPQRLERQVAFMEANPQVAVCGSWIELFGAAAAVERYPLDHEEIKCTLLFHNPLAHPSVIMRKAILEKDLLSYDTSPLFERAEDYELWERIARHYTLANIGEVLLKYRIHAHQICSQHEQEQSDASDRVRLRQLNALGLACSKDELLLHTCIATLKFPRAKAFLKQAEKWLTKITAANRHKQLYDCALLNRLAGQYWWQVCRNSFTLGLFAWNLFHTSPLTKGVHIPFAERSYFFIRCLIRESKDVCRKFSRPQANC